MIDNIATHVTTAQDYVEEAKIQTGEALKYQGKARKVSKRVLGGDRKRERNYNRGKETGTKGRKGRDKRERERERKIIEDTRARRGR